MKRLLHLLQLIGIRARGKTIVTGSLKLYGRLLYTRDLFRFGLNVDQETMSDEEIKVHLKELKQAVCILDRRRPKVVRYWCLRNLSRCESRKSWREFMNRYRSPPRLDPTMTMIMPSFIPSGIRERNSSFGHHLPTTRTATKPRMKCI